MAFSPSSPSYITPVELVYRELCKPTPPKPAPNTPDPPAPIRLEWSDVDAILKNKRGGSIDELQHVIDNARRFKLSTSQRNEISLRMTVALASRGRQANPNADLFAQLDITDTPRGLLHHRSWFERELRMGAQGIAMCKLHRPPRCECWRSARERLWRVQDRYGAKSPEGWAGTRVFEGLDELETSSKRNG